LTDTAYNRKEPSPLRIMVRRELEKMFIEQVKSQLNEMRGSWGANNKMQAGEVVKAMVKEIAPELWELAVAGVVQKAIEGFRNNLSTSMQY